MKFRIANLPKEILISELVVVIIDSSKIKKNKLASSKLLPNNLISQINACISSINYKNTHSDVGLFHFPGSEIPHMILIAIEDEEKDSREMFRKAAVKFVTYLESFKGKSAELVIISDLWDESIYINAITEGTLLDGYEYDNFKTGKSLKKTGRVKYITYLIPKLKMSSNLKQTLSETEQIMESVNFTRSLSDTPANHLTPGRFARTLEKRFLNYKNIAIKTLHESDIKKLKMQAFLSVAKGSAESPELIIIEYKSGKKNADKLLLVGKGVTFDSGGISIKPSAKMEEMKHDMSGGAAIAGVMDSLEYIKPDMDVIGVIPAAENLPDAKAYKPGDVITAYNGKTIEIINTDAEGRLLLADALAYGIKKYKPAYAIDLATLTGSIVAALGSQASGLFCNDEHLTELLMASAEVSGEKIWPLPIWDEYKIDLKSDVADLKNVGGREAGSISAAKFLEEFVDKTAWAHLDIAGTAYNQKNIPYLKTGATGVGVRLLVSLIRRISNPACKS